MRWFVAIVVVLIGCQAPVPPTPSASVRASAVGASDAVVEAFRDHSVVAIGEYHGSAAEHEFLRALLGDPRLAGVIDDVAVEFGSARHQRTIDRYVAGEEVSSAELARVWTDTTQQSGVWDNPVYRQFFDRVREVNRARPPAERIRVLLGDPPIDWTAITQTTGCSDAEPTCLDYWLFRRDEHFASIVQASIDRGRRVLVVAGAGHVLRNPDRPEARSLIDLLDATASGQTWTLVPPAPGALSSLAPYLAQAGVGEPQSVPLRTGPLAGLLADPVFRSGTVTCDPAPCPSEPPSTVTLRGVADALLIL
jgi:hypothetical protein